jgi:predicted DNA-binding transcriptional regulator AlpA
MMHAKQIPSTQLLTEIENRSPDAPVDLNREVARFDSLPDAAHTEVEVFCLLALIARSTYYKGIKDGRFPAGYKIGALRRIPVRDVREYMANPSEWASKQQECAV